jgi:hypothetical protein
VEECGYLARGLLVVQDTAAPEGQDNVSATAVDLAAGRRDTALEQTLGGWLESGRIKLADLLTPEPEGAALSSADTPLYLQHVLKAYQEQVAAIRDQTGDVPQDARIEWLSDEDLASRFAQVLEQARHTLVITLPQITDQILDAGSRQILKDLAQRNVITVLGWGSAPEQSQEERAPSKALLKSLHAIRTPEGVPAAAVWWTGNLRGKDVLADGAVQICSFPNRLRAGGAALSYGEAACHVPLPDLVREAHEHLEPLLADAAGQEWDKSAAQPADALPQLSRCCATWAALGRPDQAITRILNLARGDAGGASIALGLAGLVSSALARLPYEMLAGLGALDLMARAVPELAGLAQPTDPPGAPGLEFAQGLGRLLRQYGGDHEPELARFLEDQRAAFEKIGLIAPGQETHEAMAGLLATSAPKKKKKTSRG